MIFDQIVYITGKIVWGPHMLVLMAGIGLYFTLRLKFIQFVDFKKSLQFIWGGFRRTDKSEKKEGDISPFQAMMTSLGGAVGNGNIAGVATAITLGGPGAVFWMWIAAVLGMATKFSEVVLGVHFRKKEEDGSYSGGPMYFIREGLNWKVLAYIFAFAMGVKTLISTAFIQGNSMTLVVKSELGIPMIISGIVLAVLTWIVIIGGIKSIGRIAEFLSPFMVILYVLGGLIVILLYYKNIPSAFYQIFKSAFTGSSAAGGFAGATVLLSMRHGVAKGAYSNEAGTGSAAVVHAVAKTGEPVKQGIIAMMDVFVDTIIICSITALPIILTGEWTQGITSSEMTAAAFSRGIPVVGGLIVMFSSLLFGYSSLIGWVYYGEQCFSFLFGKWIKKPFRWMYCLFIVLSTVLNVEAVWNFGDTLNGLMAIPNLIGLAFLGGMVVKLVKENNNK